MISKVNQTLSKNQETLEPSVLSLTDCASNPIAVMPLTGSPALGSAAGVAGGVPQGRGAGGLTLISCPPLVVNSAFDTFYITYDISCENSDLFKRLQESKKLIQSGIEAECHFQFIAGGDPDLFCWNLQRIGSRFYPYILKSGDLVLSLSTRKSGSSIPNMSLKIGSMSSQQDVTGLCQQFERWLNLNDIRIIAEKVSRFDICADIKHDIKKSRLDKINQWISRARDTSLFYSNRKFTGIQMGRGDVVCRLYDKKLQMEQQGQDAKKLFFASIWNIGENDPITRVEFQLRRSAIAEFFECEPTVYEIFARAAELWKYLTGDWLKHSSKFVDRDNKNQQRAPISSIWQTIQGAFDHYVKPLTRKRKLKHVNIKSLARQAAGIMTTIVASFGVPAEKQNQILQASWEVLSNTMRESMEDKDEFGQKYYKKQVAGLLSF